MTSLITNQSSIEEESLEELQQSLLALCRNVKNEQIPTDLSYDEIVSDIYRLCEETVNPPPDGIVIIDIDGDSPRFVIDLSQSYEEEEEDDDCESVTETEKCPPSCKNESVTKSQNCPEWKLRPISIVERESPIGVDKIHDNMVTKSPFCPESNSTIKSPLCVENTASVTTEKSPPCDDCNEISPVQSISPFCVDGNVPDPDDNPSVCVDKNAVEEMTSVDLPPLDLPQPTIDYCPTLSKINADGTDKNGIEEVTSLDFPPAEIDYFSKWLKLNADGSDNLKNRTLFGEHGDSEKPEPIIRSDLQPLIPMFGKPEDENIDEKLTELIKIAKSDESMQNSTFPPEIPISENGDSIGNLKTTKNSLNENWSNIPSTSRSLDLGFKIPKISRSTNGNQKGPILDLSKVFQENSNVFHEENGGNNQFSIGDNSRQKSLFPTSFHEKSNTYQPETRFQTEINPENFAFADSRQKSLFQTDFHNNSNNCYPEKHGANENEVGMMFQNDLMEFGDSEPRKRAGPFVSSNPKENSDNNDPNWKFTRMLENDDDRYREVRQKWLNMVTPDPTMNLTTHNFWKRRLEITGFDVVNRYGKREYVATGRKLHDRKRMRLCTDGFDEQIDSLENDWRSAEFNAKVEFERRKNEIYNGGYCHDRDMDALYRLHDERLQNLKNRYSKEIEDLLKAKNEVLTFQSFYSELKNSSTADIDTTLMSNERFEEMMDTEEMYDIYNNVYGSTDM